MSTAAFFAAAAVAVGAYAMYTRKNTAQAEHTKQLGTAAKPAFAGLGSYNTLKLASSEKVNHDVKRLRFHLPDPDAKSGLTTTSALLAISWPGGRWLPVLRPYTPVNDLDTTGEIELLVKLYPTGKVSPHLHSLQPGDTLTFLRIPGYTWKTNEQSHVAAIAGGQGITPCYQLARGILANPEDKTRVTLVWGVNADEDIVLKQELADLEARHPGRFRTIYTVAKPDAGSPHRKGFVTADLLRDAGVTPGEKNGVGKIFVCGPPAMEKALTGTDGVLGALGYTKKEIHKF